MAIVEDYRKPLNGSFFFFNRKYAHSFHVLSYKYRNKETVLLIAYSTCKYYPQRSI